jgi:hypothetical protein
MALWIQALLIVGAIVVLLPIIAVITSLWVEKH